MIALLLLPFALAAEPAPVAGPVVAAVDIAAKAPALELAAVAEMERARANLRLPDAPAPYLFLYDVLDGRVATAFAENGALVSDDEEPYRNVRVEVRVGDATFDSSNFSAFGEPDGVVARRLPEEDDVHALRREIWLSTDEAYKHAVEQLSRKAASRRGDPTPRPPSWTPAPATVGGVEGAPVATIEAARLRALVTRLSTAATAAPGVELGQAISRDWQGRRLVLNSEGTRRWIPTGYTVVRVEATTRLDDGTELRDARWWVGRTAADLPSDAEMEAAVCEMSAWLSDLRAAPAEDDYLGPVLFEAPAAVELFSQLLAAEIAGTPPIEQDDGGMAEVATPPNARLGRRLLPSGWTVVDDPAAAGRAAGAYTWDHEGVEARRVELVQDGVVRDLLMSRIPRQDLAGSNGHGRSLGNDRRAAMPGVVTVTPKKRASEAKLHKAGLRLASQTGHDYLLVVRRIQPPALVENLDVTFTGEGAPAGITPPYEAYRLYADGRTEPVRSLVFSGVDRRTLRDVVLAGDSSGPVDAMDGPPGPSRFQIGATGGIPVTWDVPAVLIAEVELTSRAGGEPRVLVAPRE